MHLINSYCHVDVNGGCICQECYGVCSDYVSNFKMKVALLHFWTTKISLRGICNKLIKIFYKNIHQTFLCILGGMIPCQIKKWNYPQHYHMVGHITERRYYSLIKKFYNPVVFLHEPQIIFNPFNDVNYELARPSNVHSMFFSIQRFNQLKMQYERENNFSYDIVIRCRFDVDIIKFDIDLYNLSMDYVNCYAMRDSPNSDLAISSSKKIWTFIRHYMIILKSTGKMVGNNLLEKVW